MPCTKDRFVSGCRKPPSTDTWRLTQHQRLTHQHQVLPVKRQLVSNAYTDPPRRAMNAGIYVCYMVTAFSSCTITILEMNVVQEPWQ